MASNPVFPGGNTGCETSRFGEKCTRLGTLLLASPEMAGGSHDPMGDPAAARQAVMAQCVCGRRSGAGGRQADGSRSDVVMSGIVDSGQESGHGNIVANDPSETLAANFVVMHNRRR